MSSSRKHSMIFPEQRSNLLKEIKRQRILSSQKIGINYTGYALNPFPPNNFKKFAILSLLGISLYAFTKN